MGRSLSSGLTRRSRIRRTMSFRFIPISWKNPPPDFGTRLRLGVSPIEILRLDRPDYTVRPAVGRRRSAHNGPPRRGVGDPSPSPGGGEGGGGGGAHEGLDLTPALGLRERGP